MNFSDLLPAPRKRASFELLVEYESGSMSAKGAKRHLAAEFLQHVGRPGVTSVLLIRNGYAVQEWRR